LQSDQLVVELVGVVATYNMVSRFLVALGVEPE
jgi:alkylhydroperoxidase family enzyme